MQNECFVNDLLLTLFNSLKRQKDDSKGPSSSTEGLCNRKNIN